MIKLNLNEQFVEGKRLEEQFVGEEVGGGDLGKFWEGWSGGLR